MVAPLTNRRFGVEIECFSPVESREVAALLTAEGISVRSVGYTHSGTDQWKITTDGSLRKSEGWTGNWHAIEVVSPPLKDAEGFRQLKIVCDTLVTLGVKVNKTTGLHVHVEIKNLSYAAEVGEAALLYSQFEREIFDRMMPESRRNSNNQYCRSVAGRNCNRFLAGKYYSTTSGIAHKLGDRYCKVNLHAYSKYGTMEFRHHSGTIEYEKISNWVVILQGLIKVAQTRVARFGHVGHPDNESTSRTWEDFQAEFRNILPGESFTYIQKRIAHFKVTTEESERAVS